MTDYYIDKSSYATFVPVATCWMAHRQHSPSSPPHTLDQEGEHYNSTTGAGAGLRSGSLDFIAHACMKFTLHKLKCI